MKVEKISELTTKRLSIYLRCLNELVAENVKTISSEHFAKKFHLNSAQIRKDLAYFGEFGVRGVGYSVLELRAVPIEPEHIALGEAAAPVEAVLEATLAMDGRPGGLWSAGDLASPRRVPPWGAF